jgi:hypothetical protein
MIGKHNDHLVIVPVRRDQLRDIPTSPTTYQLSSHIYVADATIESASSALT